MYHFRELQGRYDYLVHVTIKTDFFGAFILVPFFIQITLILIMLTGAMWLLVVIGFGIGSNETDEFAA